MRLDWETEGGRLQIDVATLTEVSLADQTDRVLEQMSTAVERHPNESDVYIQRAMLYQVLGETELSQRDAAAAEKLEPDKFAQNRYLRRANSTAIVLAGSHWKWLHPVDGVDPEQEENYFHTRFATLDYNDSHWQSGQDSPGRQGGLGYGDAANVTWTTPPLGKCYSAYLRHEFVTNEELDRLFVTMQRDDGVIVYLDGKEVGRNNMANQQESYRLFANDAVHHEGETELIQFDLTGTLDPGQHVLAISLHNRAAASSDLRIAEIELRGTPLRAGQAATTAPPEEE